MNTSYITFRQKQVALQSEFPEINRGVERRFQAMMAAHPRSVLTRLRIARRDEAYVVAQPQQRGEQSAFTLADVVAWAEHESIVQFIRAYPELCWLHAGAVARYGGGLVIAGEWGQGKSTLVTHLVTQGWLYLSDDIAPVDGRTGQVYPFPLTPRVREKAGTHLPRRQVAQLRRIDVPLAPEQVGKTAVPIMAFLFPTYAPHDAACLEPISPAQATLMLVQQCLNIVRYRETAVSLFVHLLQTIPAYRLQYHHGADAARLVTSTLER